MEEHWGAGLFNQIMYKAFLLFILNLCLLTVLLSLPAYPCGTLEEAFADYAGETILEEASGGTLHSRLVKRDEEDIRLITAEKHFLFDRYRFLNTTGVNGNYIMLEGQTSQLLVNFHSLEDINEYRVSFGIPEIPEHTVLWSACLLAIEITLWFVVHKLRDG